MSPQYDPTQPWLPPSAPTPQAVGWREWWKLLKAICSAYRESPSRPGYPRCTECGTALEVRGFMRFPEVMAVWKCPRCGWMIVRSQGQQS